ncbi:MAG: PKD domain-containing protein [Pirellulales bacterium]
MSLRVIDLADNVGIATTQVVVNNVAPTANAGADQTVDEGDLVTLDGSFTDPGSNDTHSFLWQVSASNG